MKNKFIRLYVLMLGALLASCLEDDNAPLDPSGTQNVVEFADLSVPSSPAGAIYPAYITAFPVSSQDEFEVIVSYVGPQNNDKDIDLTLAVDPIALEDYNFQMDTLGANTFEMLPDENYDIADLTVTIPKGETSASLPITVYPDKFDLSKRYAIPLRIVSASSGILSAHFSAAMFVTVVKNKYDAVYDTNVGMSGWSAYNIYDGPPIHYGFIGLATTGPNSVQLSNLEAGTDLLPGFSVPGPSATQFGDASPIFYFDENDKVTSIDNGYAGNARGRKFILNPAATAEQNKFDPINRSIVFNFLFQQNGRPDNTVIMEMVFEEER
jgi:hypothetical protein